MNATTREYFVVIFKGGMMNFEDASELPIKE
jgi:hypothetical protein